MSPHASMNAHGRPVARDVALAHSVNTERDFVGRTETSGSEREPSGSDAVA